MLTHFGEVTLSDLDRINGAGLVSVLIAIVFFLVVTVILLLTSLVLYLRERKGKQLSKATKITFISGIAAFIVFSVLYSLYFLR